MEIRGSPDSQKVYKPFPIIFGQFRVTVFSRPFCASKTKLFRKDNLVFRKDKLVLRKETFVFRKEKPVSRKEVFGFSQKSCVSQRSLMFLRKVMFFPKGSCVSENACCVLFAFFAFVSFV